MSLRLAASAGAVQTLVSMALSFLSIKVTSVYLGPSGIGALGQLTYFIALTQAVLAAGLHTGLVRRIAVLREDRTARDRVISTVLLMLLLAGIPSALAIAVSSSWLAAKVLYDGKLDAPFLVLSASFVFGLVAMVITACANGAKDFWSLAWINIGTGLSSVVMLTLLCPRFGLDGGLFATAVLPIFTAAIGYAIARRHEWWPKRPLVHGFSAPEAKGVVAFVPMAMVTAIGLPLIQLLIRDAVVARSGMNSVGLLQGVMRISDMYLGVASGIFAMYFFARFSEIRDAAELVHEAGRGFLVIVPAVALASVVIYLLRDWIVRLVFTVDFLPMRDLFGWQAFGNTLKMIGWLFGYILLAKANALLMAALEVATFVAWWLLSVYFIERNGVVGAPQAYAITYAIYSLVTFVGVALVVARMRARTQVAA
jgi:O-antigen/teichoic acid export membrane protein